MLPNRPLADSKAIGGSRSKGRRVVAEGQKTSVGPQLDSDKRPFGWPAPFGVDTRDLVRQMAASRSRRGRSVVARRGCACALAFGARRRMDAQVKLTRDALFTAPEYLPRCLVVCTQ